MEELGGGSGWCWYCATDCSWGRKKTELDRIGQEGPFSFVFGTTSYIMASAGHLNSRVQYLTGRKEECKGGLAN